MTDEKIKDQEVNQENGFNEADGNSSCEGTPCDNVADDKSEATDKPGKTERSPLDLSMKRQLVTLSETSESNRNQQYKFLASL